MIVLWRPVNRLIRFRLQQQKKCTYYTYTLISDHQYALISDHQYALISDHQYALISDHQYALTSGI